MLLFSDVVDGFKLVVAVVAVVVAVGCGGGGPVLLISRCVLVDDLLFFPKVEEAIDGGQSPQVDDDTKQSTSNSRVNSNVVKFENTTWKKQNLFFDR